MRSPGQLFRAMGKTIAPAKRRVLNLELLEPRQLLSVSYGGGPLLQNVQIQNVYYGQAWSTTPSLQQTIAQTDTFLQYFVTSPFIAVLAQYKVGDGTVVGQDDVVNQNPPSGQTISDGQIQQALSAEIAAQHVVAPSTNTLYIFYTTPGVVVTDDGENSINDFAGYHNVYTDPAGTTVYYAVIPYPSGGLANIPLTDFQQETIPLSHEISESMTDPDTQTGWLDPQGNEICDLANGQIGTMNGYVVTGVYSNAAGQVVFPSATSGINLQPAGTQFDAGAGQAFTDIVATFTSTDAAATAASFTAAIDWGDGNTTNGAIVADSNGGFDVLGTHTYANTAGSGSGLKPANPGHRRSTTGTFDITVGIQDVTDNSAATADSVASVTAAPPNLVAYAQFPSLGAGVEYAGPAATFTDSDGSSASSFTATISWGDGTTSNGTITATGAGDFSVNGTHTWNNSGSYTVFVRIQEAGGDSAVSLGTATIAPTRFPVALGFLHSTEYDTDLIVKDYQQYLLRSPSSAEVGYWLNLMQQGASDTQVQAGFLASPAFFGLAGNTNKSWVDTLYLDLLDRPADPVGEAYWLQQLTDNVSRNSVALSIATSQEGDTDRVQSYYQQCLGRTGSAAEIAYWANDLQVGATDAQVVAGIVSSSEFYTRSGNTDKAWVDALYLALLNRPADAGGESYWLQTLSNAGL